MGELSRKKKKMPVKIAERSYLKDITCFPEKTFLERIYQRNITGEIFPYKCYLRELTSKKVPENTFQEEILSEIIFQRNIT